MKKFKLTAALSTLTLFGGLTFFNDSIKILDEKAMELVTQESDKTIVSQVELLHSSVDYNEQKVESVENRALVAYMNEVFNVTTERAELLVELIEEHNTKFHTYDIISLIAIESSFENKQATNGLEDSMGYVQMKSETIDFLKNNFPELPQINTQQEFQLAIDAQIEYMITYLNYISDLKGTTDFDTVASAYNLGHNSDNFNSEYTGRHFRAKYTMENFLNNKEYQIKYEDEVGSSL